DAAATEATVETTDPAAETTAADVEVAGDITVFAAASLTGSFTEIGAAFTVEHPDANVVFNFAGSSDLVAQINEGAPADVFASADQNNMTTLTDAAGNAGDPVVFARNSLEIAVEPGNPNGITGVADLANPDLVIVTTAPEVPIGKYTQEVFTNAGVTVTPASFEADVKAVLNKVVLGEADAGVVYSTDVEAAGDAVTGVEIPADINVTPEYPIVATAAAPNAPGAAAFTEFVLGEAGQKILQSYGFSAP
ncbi:MAG: molybdate ABC transporter substrate-binding protein, partial [Ilumatobacteraceae bacterium]